MSNSYRIRTQLGVDKSVRVHLSQEYEFLEILSLKVLQNEIYTRQCSDYGVVIGRISINGGFGLPNCKISIFIPLSAEDENNPIISSLYPYQSVSDLNDVGYRYNLLPSTKSYSAHVPTGSFFDKEDVLVNQSYIEVFDKYYRYTAVTNESGDFMIFGVPIGTQTIHVDVDLSDIGEFSLAPQDLIRTGLATEAQVSGTRFKSSANLNELPQIISINRVITVEPLWGQADLCNIGITRTDFDLSSEANVVIEPTAIFMGSIFSDVDNLALKKGCKPKVAQGELCSLTTGPGEILAIRQTIFEDAQGRPTLEQYELESGGQVIDDNGTWLVDLPMNLDYVTTNEFGERVFSDNPEEGIPTRGKYRFKIKWNQSPNLDENVRRAYFLVPNVREYGWTTSNNNTDPLISPTTLQAFESAKKSYAFSLDWNDYGITGTSIGNQMIQDAINCDDRFYQFSYNKVYTISQLIDQYRNGSLANRIISVKNILDNTCESTNNKFPTNDASFRWDFIFLLYTFASYVFRPILVALVPVVHFLFFLVILLRVALIPLLLAYLVGLTIALVIKIAGAAAGVFSLGMVAGFILEGVYLVAAIIGLSILLVELFKIKLKGINLPLLLYDQCEFCSCSDAGDLTDDGVNVGSSSLPPPPPPPIPNVSGIQITNFEGGFYNSDLLIDNFEYTFINQIITGKFIQYPPQRNVYYSKVPLSVSGQYDPPGGFGLQQASYRTRSLTIAERINLFNTKAKYFDETTDNPGGGVNQVYVSIEPTLNGGGYVYNNNPNQPYTNPNPNYHTDNVVMLMMTPDSLTSLPIGSLLTFVDPNKTFDINYSGAVKNDFDNNAITGISRLNLVYANQPVAQISVPFSAPDGVSRFAQYFIPKPSTGSTNYHKFPTDIEYFQVLTAMTYNQYTGMTNNSSITLLPNSLDSRFLNNDMLLNIQIVNDCGNPDDYAANAYISNVNPLTSLENFGQQIIVFLSRGVDPYTTRVNTRYDMGRLFGYYNPQTISFTANTHLNYPVQGGFKNVNHINLSSDISVVETYGNNHLYFPTFDYVPAPNPSLQQFSGFSSNLPRYYSALDNTTPSNGFWPNCQDSSRDNTGGSLSGSKGRYINDTNFMIYEYWDRYTFGSTSYVTRPTTGLGSQNSFSGGYTRGYYENEIVEGASYMFIAGAEFPLPPFIASGRYYLQWEESLCFRFNSGYENGGYYAPTYSSIQWNFPQSMGTTQRLIMRSDRLPTSDRELTSCVNSYSLQQNQNLGMYLIPDEGAFEVPSNTSGASVGPQQVEVDDTTTNFTQTLLASTNNCRDSRNLECYRFVANRNLQDGTNPGGGDYIVDSGNCQRYEGKLIFENGCYKLVTTVFVSLFKDIQLVTEWLSRTNITFGACRNVFSHLFTHNWVNGTLYAFAFKNNKTTDILGNDNYVFCRDVLYFDSDTNNFYYRSSPYKIGNNEGFIGRNAPLFVKPNKRNLLFPTTIIDLGPRSEFLQEIVFSDEYDGYVVNQLKSTSYQDVSEMLNLLIINRLANTSFISILIGANGGSIFEYFTREPLFSINQRLSVDADYAQMISINSELGVVPFEADAYQNSPAPPAPQVVIDPVYFNTGQFQDTIFGIFYSSDTQIRDFITPKRTIINNQVLLDNSCAFNNFYCYSQEVPYYQWQIKDSNNTPPPANSIFGSQRNDWWTEPINGQTFHSFKYQSLDRADRLSRYFRTGTSFFAGDFKGYIYSVDTRAIPPSPFWVTPSLNPLNRDWDRNTGPNISNDDLVTVGAPFYFYFGLRKGASAWDRFAKKWINTEPNTQ